MVNKFLVFVMMGGLLLLGSLGPLRPVAYAQSPVVWSTPITISGPNTFNWFADIAVDSEGTPHIVWDGGLTLEEKLYHPKRSVPLLMHSQLVDSTWTKPLDIVATSAEDEATIENVYQAALFPDQMGRLWLWYGGNLRWVSARQANNSAAEWSSPFSVSHGVSFSGNVYLDKKDVMHALYDQEAPLVKDEFGLSSGPKNDFADIFYRRSLDQGKTWLGPVNLSQTTTAESRSNLEMDTRGVLYVTWDEGFDRLTRTGKPEQGILIVSHDGGNTWSAKTTFAYPEQSNVQLAAIGDGQGNVLAVWRTTTRREIFYSWSTDDGVSWGIPKPIPGIFARPWEELTFDGYDLVVDSTSSIHLAAVGRPRANRPASHLYHLIWDGQEWSEPQAVYDGPGWPEYPRLTISQGNQLHLAWFVRDELKLTPYSQYQIWYSSAVADAPAQSLPAIPTPTPTQPPITAHAATPMLVQPLVSQEEVDAVRGTGIDLALDAEAEDNLISLFVSSLAPLALLIIALIVWQRFIAHRL